MFLLDQTDKDAGIIFWKKFAFLCSDTFPRIIQGAGCETDGLEFLLSFFQDTFHLRLFSFVIGFLLTTAGGEGLSGPRCEKQSSYQPAARDHRGLRSLL